MNHYHRSQPPASMHNNNSYPPPHPQSQHPHAPYPAHPAHPSSPQPMYSPYQQGMMPPTFTPASTPHVGPPSQPTVMHRSGENPVAFHPMSSGVHVPSPSSASSLPPAGPSHSGSISAVNPANPADPRVSSAAIAADKTSNSNAEPPPVGFRFHLTHADGKKETMVVDSERALIGSAAHCEVRLPPELVAHEHVEVFADGGKIHIATRAFGREAAVPSIDGVSLTEGPWPKGTILTLAGTQLTVELVDLAPARAKPPYAVILAALMILGTVIATILLAHPPAKADPPIPEAPVLLPPKEAAACPPTSTEQRPMLAAEKLRIALAKRERSPFSPVDGLDAVIFFETAGACFRQSSMPNEAKEADHSADVLRHKLDEDYRVRRIRLEHAYRIHDTMAVKRELNVLIPMTARNRGPYTDWLLALDRAVNDELNRKGKLGL